MSTAQTGRTHDLHPTASKKPKKSLDPWAPSTHDPEPDIQDVAAPARFLESNKIVLAHALQDQEHC